MSNYPGTRESQDVDQAAGGEFEATGASTTGEFESAESAASPVTPTDRELPPSGDNLEPQYPENPASRFHTVAAGETLSAIAEQYYGDASSATRIFEANQDRLSNPDLIYPGQQLAIPE